MKIFDKGSGLKYFAQIPHLIDDSGLSPYAVRLYLHLKRVAGESGECWQSTNTLARKCNMSMGSISSAKQELKAAGFIDITTVKSKSGKPSHVISINDIWPENMKKYESMRSGDERITSPGEVIAPVITSPGEIKNNPLTIKNNPLINKQESCQNFYSEFSQTLQIPLMGGKELEYLKDLQQQHSDDKLLKIAAWLKERDPDINSMFKALRAIDTAAEKWTDAPPTKRQKGADNRKKIFEMLEQEA